MKKIILIIFTACVLLSLYSCNYANTPNYNMLEQIDSYWQTEDGSVWLYVYDTYKAAGKIEKDDAVQTVYINYDIYHRTYEIYSIDAFSQLLLQEEHRVEVWKIKSANENNCTITVQEGKFFQKEEELELIMKKDHSLEVGNNIDNMVNHSDGLDTLLTKKYDIDELKKYFGEISGLELNVYRSKNKASDDTNWKYDLNNSFKITSVLFDIQCLRKVDDMYYSVFSVKQGGLYYVFWCEPFGYYRDSIPIYAVYINDFVDSNAFKSLKPGISTAIDVCNISSACDIRFMKFGRPYSYTLLENGELLRVIYQSRDELNSRADLIIEEIEVVTQDNTIFDSYLTKIFSEDLHNN